MASSSISNADSIPVDSSRKKRRKISGDDSAPSSNPKSSPIRWKSESEQRIYSSKLVDAIRETRRRSVAVAGSTVRDTAERVLAISARGTTRWSRAILANRHRLLRNRLKHRKVAKQKITGASAGAGKIRSPRPAVRRLPAVHKKVKILSRLVPGCRKIPFENLLEETSDYISALEMQIRAMAALAELLAGSPVS